MEGLEEVERFRTDMRVIGQLEKGKNIQEWIQPRGVSDLVAIMKNKTKREGRISEHLQRGRDWLCKKGVNIQSLLTRIDKQKKMVSRESFQPEASDDCFSVKLNLRTIPEYLQKNNQYAIMNLAQYSMSRRNWNKQFLLKYMRKSLEEGPGAFPVWQGQNHKEKRRKYIQLVKSASQRRMQGSDFSQQLLKEFRSSMNELGDECLWEILSYQLQTYRHDTPHHVNMTRIFVTSLKLIQQEYQKRLHGQDFQRYVSRSYVTKVEGKWAMEHGGFWAKVWCYYCLGMKQDVVSLLSSGVKDYRDLVQLYVTTEEALSQGKPLREYYSARYQVEDIFFDQFIFNITGQSRYSCEFMTDPLSLQLVMIAIRTLAIYYETQQYKFQEIKTKMLRNYRDFTSDPQIMKNILYLLDYNQIIRMGPNVLMSGDDYLHFLIIMSKFGQLVDQHKLQEALSKYLVKFVIELLTQNQSEYVYYIKLFPEQDLMKEVSSIILSADAIDKFNWKGMKELLEEDVYEDLVYYVVEQFRLRSRDELKAAKKIRELLEDGEKSITYLLDMMAGHYLNRYKYELEKVNEAVELGTVWSEEIGIPRVYSHVFKFIKNYRRLNSLLAHKNQHQLLVFVSSSEFLTVEQRSNPFNVGMLEILKKSRGLQLYYEYLFKIIKGTELCISRLGDSDKLALVKQLVGESVQIIEKMSYEIKSQRLGELRQMLREQMY